MINMTESNDFKYIVWEESFSNGAPLTKNAVVQVWKDWTGFHPPSTIRSAIQRGFKALLSAPWYFDWPERGFVNSCVIIIIKIIVFNEFMQKLI